MFSCVASPSAVGDVGSRLDRGVRCVAVLALGQEGLLQGRKPTRPVCRAGGGEVQVAQQGQHPGSVLHALPPGVCQLHSSNPQPSVGTSVGTTVSSAPSHSFQEELRSSSDGSGAENE